MRNPRIWILVADGARARILLPTETGHSWKTSDVLTYTAEHAATHDLVTDREGRSYSSHDARRSGIEAHSDPHRELKRTFAGFLATTLSQKLADGAFDKVVVIAPAVTMGDLRSALGDTLKAHLAGELTLDLTKAPDSDVVTHVKNAKLA